eukprot:CAMPEP_0168735220 /NCGR_PEP_ID=MMETSP0724-20121128/9218_1 /TAXON_ID=265536 /ORGANISM="Amphiprora sp., Strain CCMP467" /LENGTH=188 /DNA_ID=CAMNT_0008782351 /DNA_START=104 /DNA_END=670 /DNA_ORIENTATION=+
MDMKNEEMVDIEVSLRNNDKQTTTDAELGNPTQGLRSPRTLRRCRSSVLRRNRQRSRKQVVTNAFSTSSHKQRDKSRSILKSSSSILKSSREDDSIPSSRKTAPTEEKHVGNSTAANTLTRIVTGLKRVGSSVRLRKHSLHRSLSRPRQDDEKTVQSWDCDTQHLLSVDSDEESEEMIKIFHLLNRRE